MQPHPPLLRPTDAQVGLINEALQRECPDLLSYLAQSVLEPLPDAHPADVLMWVQCSQPRTRIHRGCQLTLVVHNRRTGEFLLVRDAREADIRRDHLEVLLGLHQDYPA